VGNYETSAPKLFISLPEMIKLEDRRFGPARARLFPPASIKPTHTCRHDPNSTGTCPHVLPRDIRPAIDSGSDWAGGIGLRGRIRHPSGHREHSQNDNFWTERKSMSKLHDDMTSLLGDSRLFF